MDDERLFGSLDFRSKIRHPVGMAESKMPAGNSETANGRLEEIARIEVPERTVSLPHSICDGRPEIDLQDLKGLAQQVTQPKIEIIGVANLLEGGSWKKGVARSVLEGQAVATESVIIHMA